MAVFDSASGGLDRSFDYLCKIILIGDASVGKTGLTLRFCEDNYNMSYTSTIGIDFKLRTVILDDKKIKLQIWDTAGQERFQTLTRVYYRGTAGAIFVYDITRNKTFESIETWLAAFENATGTKTKIPKVLIGNKVDKSIDREVGYARAQAVANKFDMRFCEASAKTGYNVENAFFALARDIIAQKDESSKRDAMESFGLEGSQRKTQRRKKWYSKCHIL